MKTVLQTKFQGGRKKYRAVWVFFKWHLKHAYMVLKTVCRRYYSGNILNVCSESILNLGYTVLSFKTGLTVAYFVRITQFPGAPCIAPVFQHLPQAHTDASKALFLPWSFNKSWYRFSDYYYYFKSQQRIATVTAMQLDSQQKWLHIFFLPVAEEKQPYGPHS